MRQRRIDRLLLRAQVSHEAGDDDEARQALQEAEELTGRTLTLSSLDPALEPFVEQPLIDLPLASDLEARPASRRASWGPHVAALLTAGIMLLWFAGPRVTGRPAATGVAAPTVQGTAPISSDVATPEPTPGADLQPAPESPPTDLPAVQLSVTEVPADIVVTDAAPTGTRAPVSLAGFERPEPAATTPEARPRAELAALPPVSAVAPSPAPPPALPLASSTPLDAAAVGPAPMAPPVTTPASSGNRSSVSENDEAAVTRPAVDTLAVRAALSHYESAYSRLDADAAGAVWPGLDRKALARAFEGLASQQVRLSSCDIRIIGESAMAECAGSATWTPKIGGGTRSEARRWQFRLRNADAGWQIVSANVR